MQIHIDDAHRFLFESEGMSFQVYKDGEGPGVLILHELPGMTRGCIELADRIMREGFTVYLPLLFGDPYDDNNVKGLAHVTAMCVRHEFECFATDKTSHLSIWLRALCARMNRECPGKGVGAIGMCVTGGLILSVMIESSVLVPVMSQPATPMHELPLPFGPSEQARKESLGIAPEELEITKGRAKTAPILGYRFTTDTISPPERFVTLCRTFGANFKGTEIPTGRQNPGNIKDKSHSVLTAAFVDEPDHPTRKAYDEILDRFNARLRL